MPWLWLSQQCWEGNQDLNVDKYPQNLLMDIQILNHVAFATNMCARMFERLVLPICKFGSRTVGCCEHVASVLRYPSYQRNQTGEVLSETNYCGTVNVLYAADTTFEQWVLMLNNISYDYSLRQDFSVRNNIFYFVTLTVGFSLSFENKNLANNFLTVNSRALIFYKNIPKDRIVLLVPWYPTFF